MSKVLITESYLDAIADAIRGKNGTQNTYTPAQMAAAVQAISTGSNIPVLLMVTTQPTKNSYDVGDELDLTGIVVTATYSDGTAANVTSSCTFSPADGDTLSAVGTQTITATYTVTDTSTGHNYTLTLTATTSVTVTAPAVTIVPFSTGTDEQIAAMIDAAHNGTIDLKQDGGWAVGDVRTISVGSFTGDTRQHSAQNVDIVITSFEEYMNCGNVLQLDFKTLIAGTEKMYNNDTNIVDYGGYGSTPMKQTTLPALANALPAWIKDRLIEFSVIAANAGGSSPTFVTVTGNKLALRSAGEVFGNISTAVPGDGTQLAYYAESSHRIKTDGSQNSFWWTRTPSNTNFYHYIRVDSDGNNREMSQSTSYQLVGPFGCL